MYLSVVLGPAPTAEEERIAVKERYGFFIIAVSTIRSAHHGPPPPFPARLVILQPPCKRCQQSGTPCIFEKPEKKGVQGLSNGSIESVMF